ncbi:hypothetical protein ACYRFS_09345 [Listeria kieliensis]
MKTYQPKRAFLRSKKNRNKSGAAMQIQISFLKIVGYLILAFGIPGVGLVFSILLLRDLRETSERGFVQVLAIIALVLQILGLALFVIDLAKKGHKKAFPNQERFFSW